MDDTRVTDHIEQLVTEEHRLLEAHAEGDGLGPEEHARLERVKVELDKYWDLLRQRRARERAGLDPDDASLRDAEHGRALPAVGPPARRTAAREIRPYRQTAGATLRPAPELRGDRRDGHRHPDLQELHRRRVGRRRRGPHRRRPQPGHGRGDRPGAELHPGGRRARRQGRARGLRGRLGNEHARPSARWRSSSWPTRSRSAPTRSPSSSRPTPASRSRPSRATRSRPWSTTCASSPAPRAAWRARRPASTSRATPR